MAYTEPTDSDWETNDIPTQAQIKTQILDNLRYLKAAVDNYAISGFYKTGWGEALSNGTGLIYLGPAPSLIDGYNLMKVTVCHATAGDTRATEVTVKRGRHATPSTAYAWVDMLTTHVTIDLGEYSSLDAAVPQVIDLANDDVLEGDIFRIDLIVHAAGAEGLYVTLEFAKP